METCSTTLRRFRGKLVGNSSGVFSEDAFLRGLVVPGLQLGCLQEGGWPRIWLDGAAACSLMRQISVTGC